MTLPDWLRSPEFPDPEMSIRAAALWRIGVVFLGFGIPAFLFVFAAPHPVVIFLMAAAANAAWLAVLTLVRRGKLDAAARLLVGALWVAQTGGLSLTGGLESPTILTYVVVILAAGLLLGERGALICALMSGAVVVTLSVVEVAGFALPNLFEDAHLFLVPVLISTFTGAYVIISAARRQIRASEELSRRYEAELRQSQQLEALGRLAGAVAHDFNNLLMGILGFAEVLKRRVGADAKARQAAEQVQSAAQSAADLTSQLLAFSRRPSHRSGPVDLNAVIQEMLPMLERLLGDDVRVVTHLADRVPPVGGQRAMFDQVVLNLVVNARDAMPTGGTLTIATRAERDGDVGRVVLTVQDDGVGMDEHVRGRAFEPFFTTRSGSGGTGLGLSTVYGVVRQCGGEVQLHSTRGHGTTFEVSLPATSEPESGADAVIEGAAAPERKVVLVVEDDDRVRELLLHVVTDAGHEVLEAKSGEEALSIARDPAAAIDLLVSDVVMGGLSGIELAERLRSSRPELLVLLISGYAARAGGAPGQIPESVAFLQKPFLPAELMETIAQIFASSRSCEESDSLSA